MAHITIPERELMKAKNKIGVYSQLRRTNQVIPTQSTITSVIETAFRDYARKHGCKPEMETKEWLRFQTILKKYL